MRLRMTALWNAAQDDSASEVWWQRQHNLLVRHRFDLFWKSATPALFPCPHPTFYRRLHHAAAREEANQVGSQGLQGPAIGNSATRLCFSLLHLTRSLRVQNERREPARRFEVEALGHKNQPAAGSDDHWTFIGGEDLLLRFRFRRPGRKRGGSRTLRGNVGTETGVFSAQRIGVKLGKGTRRGSVFPGRHIEERDGFGTGLFRSSPGAEPLAGPVDSAVPRRGKVARSVVATQDFSQNMQIQLSHLAYVVRLVELVHQRMNVRQQRHGGQVLALVLPGIDDLPTRRGWTVQSPRKGRGLPFIHP